MEINKSNISQIKDVELLRLLKGEVSKSLYVFVQFVFRILLPNEKFQTNWHIKYICDILQKETERIVQQKPKDKNILINVPPRSLKSIICNVAWPAWSWIKSPSLKWISSSCRKDLSLKMNVDCRKVIESTLYRTLFPDLMIAHGQNQKSRFENLYGGSKLACSTESGVVGEGADIIIFDDPLEPKKRRSDLEREKAIEHVKQLSTRLNDSKVGLIAGIMQRLHETDPSGYLLKNKSDSWFHICIPAVLTSKVKPKELEKKYIDKLFFPDRFPELVLKEKEYDLGVVDYEGQFLQNPSPVAGNIIKREWFPFISYEKFTVLLKKAKNAQKIYITDSALTEEKENDATGTIGGVLINGYCYIFCAEKVRLEFPELIEYIPLFLERNEYDYKSILQIEPKVNGHSIVQQLKKDTTINVMKLKAPTDSKEERLQTRSYVIKTGRVIIVTGVWNEEFIDDIVGFPYRDDKEFVDCLCYLIDACFDESLKKIFTYDTLIISLFGMDNDIFYNIIKDCPRWDSFEYIIMSIYEGYDGSDYNIISVFGIDKDNTFYLIAFKRIKCNPLEFSKRIMALYTNFQPNYVITLNNSLMQIQDYFKNQEIRIISEKESRYKLSLIESLDVIAVWWKQGRIKLPNGSKYAREQSEIIMQEFNQLNYIDIKDKKLFIKKGIINTFWLAFKGLYIVNNDIQF